MQLSKNPRNDDNGNVLKKDFENLKTLGYIDQNFVPKTFQEGTITYHNSQRQVIFTEFLHGYHELHNNFEEFYTITAKKERRFFSKEKMQPIMDSIIQLLTHYYFASFNKKTNQGIIIPQAQQNAGDFLLGEKEEVKLITARSLSKADPKEFLYFLLSKNEAVYEQSIGGTIFIGYYPTKITEPEKSCNPLLQAMTPFFDNPRIILKKWLSELRTDIKKKNNENINLALEQKYTAIPQGYRRMMEIIGAGYTFMEKFSLEERMDEFRTNKDARNTHQKYVDAITSNVYQLEKIL